MRPWIQDLGTALAPGATATHGARDVFSQLVHGSRSAVTVGLTAAFFVVAARSDEGVDVFVVEAADAVESLVADGLEKTQQRFNR